MFTFNYVSFFFYSEFLIESRPVERAKIIHVIFFCFGWKIANNLVNDFQVGGINNVFTF